VAAVLRARLSVAAAAAALVMPGVELWAEDDAEKKPFELPTYSGEKPSIHPPEKPIKPSPIPDSRDLYQRALDCWPAPSYMRAEIGLEGNLRSDQTNYLDGSGNIRATGRAAVGIVARLPLYSALELDKEREREFSRRTKLADAVGVFITALSERMKARRELELARSLERRSQERVKIGVAETAEQVKYLERVASLEGDLMKLGGQLEKSRLELISHCPARTADALDVHLVQFIKGR